MMREFEVYGLFSGLVVAFVLALVLMWVDAGFLVSVLGIVIVSCLLALFAVPEVYRDFALPSVTSFIVAMCLWIYIHSTGDVFWYVTIMIAALMFALFWVVVAISDIRMSKTYR